MTSIIHRRKEEFYEERDYEMQKRDPADLRGAGGTAETGCPNGGYRITVSADADYQPSQRLSGNPAGTAAFEQ